MITCSLLHQLWSRPGFGQNGPDQWENTHSETVAVRSWLPRVFCGESKSLKINIGRNYSFVRSSRIVCRLPRILSWHLSLLKIYMWSKFLAAQVFTLNACELRRFFFDASEQTKRLYNTHGAKALNTPSWSTSVASNRWICLEPQIRVWLFVRSSV